MERIKAITEKHASAAREVATNRIADMVATFGDPETPKFGQVFYIDADYEFTECGKDMICQIYNLSSVSQVWEKVEDPDDANKARYKITFGEMNPLEEDLELARDELSVTQEKLAETREELNKLKEELKKVQEKDAEKPKRPRKRRRIY
jgi:septation ring formation regulator EzrA